MSPTLHHECTRVPVTALASCGALLIAAEGPYLRFYHAKTCEFIASKRVFKAQAVHGVSVYAEDIGNVTKLVVWGGRLVRALRLNASINGPEAEPLSLCLSNVVKAPDWILDLAPRMGSLDDEDVYNQGICAAVTAHNALLEITIVHQNSAEAQSGSLNINMSELTASSRSILYSAHLLWESSNCILVAAGTAFGEIMYWSWTKSNAGEAHSQIHQVFLGHEGSIFDVRISQELQRGCCGNLKRVIASCSDDRTIRLWDVSDVDVNTNDQEGDLGSDAQRTRHTGFSVAATDEKPETSNCLAIGWGHTSRVWRVRFLESSPCDGALSLLSAGEDATSRTWKLVASTGKGDGLPCSLQQTDCSAYHNGKNMWSIAAYRPSNGSVRVASGAADGKIATYPLVGAGQHVHDQGISVAEYTLQDLIHMAEPTIAMSGTLNSTKALKKGDSIRSYCFISDKTFLLITNTGKVLIESFRPPSHSKLSSSLTDSTLVDQIEDLSGYSICTGNAAHEVAFLAGTKGSIYMYSARDSSLKKIHAVTGKVGALFVTDTHSSEGRKQLALLVTLVGQKHSQLLFVDITSDPAQPSSEALSVPVSEILTGSTMTSMALVDAGPASSTLLVGYRRGSIAFYDVPRNTPGAEASLFRTIDKVHGDETVTRLMFRASSENASVGHLYSVGRDGCLAVHAIDIPRNTTTLIHNLTLPIGPNIEGLFTWRDRVLVHGFSSKKWVLYDLTSSEEVMSIETGGAHRSWAFQPNFSSSSSSSSSSEALGGSLVWTRTASLHICSQTGSNHAVLRSGGHGREIKALAISPPISTLNSSGDGGKGRTLIATGAEDTDIKLFTYDYGKDELLCKQTLRKHTTGIQHLAWSDDGEYLFSSAGNEEFYIWHVRPLPSSDVDVDIGVVCEAVYLPESEEQDLRILSFDIVHHHSNNSYTIALVFSDSSVKMYTYSPTQTPRWRPLAAGIYATSCLTQTSLVSRELLVTAGTDGHVVFWPIPEPQVQEQGSAQLRWETRLRVHQNNVQTMATQSTSRGTLLVSGGDDGGLGFVLVRQRVRPNASSAPGTAVAQTAVSSTETQTKTDGRDVAAQANSVSSAGNVSSTGNVSSAGYASSGSVESVVSPPVLVPRAHASAVTACAIFTRSLQRSPCEASEEIYVLTAGNDEWVRLWLVTITINPINSLSSSSSSSCSSTSPSSDDREDEGRKDAVSVQRLCRCKTSVADVSSMAVLSSDDIGARVLVCGVGMEVLRVEYGSETEESHGNAKAWIDV